ncbi:MAG: hypothetical protein HC880_02165 [Bacteroidia bacterium]|nr:hypothetical protein [Bacteroidia bacterium]
MLDQTLGGPLIGATILVQNPVTENVVGGIATDLEGKFSINKLPVGTYNVRVSYVSYETKQINNVAINAGDVTVINVALAESGAELGPIVIEAEAIEQTEVNILEDRRNTPMLTDAIGSEGIAQTGALNLAGAIRRVTGVSVEGGRYAYVRASATATPKPCSTGCKSPAWIPNETPFNWI